MATGDFNNDNMIDIAVVTDRRGTIIFFGNGDGTFWEASTISAGGFKAKALPGDFNNDHKLDLAISSGSSFFIYLNTDDGTFQRSGYYFLGWSDNIDLVKGDYNKDGMTDIAAKYYDSYTYASYVNIFIGNGDGTFHSLATYKVGAWASAMTTGDVNNDGEMDLIVADWDYYTSYASIVSLVGTGEGTFPIQVKDGIGNNISRAIAASDYNRDGKLDMAGASDANVVSIFLNVYGGEPLGSIIINNGAISTNSTIVTLSLLAIDDSGAVSQMRLTNDGEIWSEWETYSTAKTWDLLAGYGTKTACVQFQDGEGNISIGYCDTIYLDPTTPAELASVLEEMIGNGEISDSGVAKALVSLLTQAQSSMEQDRASAKRQLVAAINILEVQSYKKITAGAAQKLIDYLNNIINNL